MILSADLRRRIAHKGCSQHFPAYGEDKDILALIQYISDEDKLAKILENPSVIRTPIVRIEKFAEGSNKR